MNIHDSGYKKLFSNQTIFRQLLETFVNQEWVDNLDFASCEPLDKSFISEHYKETESDLIYKIQFHDREVYIYILIEFQSTVEPFMALRVLNYITNFYMDFLVNNRDVKKLPAVFPIVLYNGEAPWTAPVNLSALIEQNPTPHFRCIRVRFSSVCRVFQAPDWLRTGGYSNLRMPCWFFIASNRRNKSVSTLFSGRVTL